MKWPMLNDRDVWNGWVPPGGGGLCGDDPDDGGLNGNGNCTGAWAGEFNEPLLY